jgi:glutaminyl-peptide cyclotransferase
MGMNRWGRGCHWALAFVLGSASTTVRAQSAMVTPVVHQTYPHDSQAFTQGLVFWQGDLYESTGLYGHSSLRLVDITTGDVERQISLPSGEFGEGLALVDDRLIQLTWKEGVANVYAVDSFQELTTFPYSGEGWGLCYDGKKLVMSDGTSSLFFRDPHTFELQSSLSVERDGQSVRHLNELECVNGFVYANIWQREEIVKIDAQSGQVIATVRVQNLLTSADKQGTDVLNGIAFNPDNKRFYITGKLWPKLFEVEFPGASDPYLAATDGNDTTTSGSARTLTTNTTSQATATNANTLPVPARVANGCRCGLGSRAHQAQPWGVAAWLVGISFCRRRRQRCRNTL